jgi:hypothetical protein
MGCGLWGGDDSLYVSVAIMMAPYIAGVSSLPQIIYVLTPEQVKYCRVFPGNATNN